MLIFYLAQSAIMAANNNIAAIWAAQLLDKILEEVWEIVGGLDDTLPYDHNNPALKGPNGSDYGTDSEGEDTLPWGE